MPSPRPYRPSDISRAAAVKKNFRLFAIFLAVAFVFFQIRMAGDPVEMYLRVVGDAASPAMNFSGSNVLMVNGAGDMRIDDGQSGQSEQSGQSGQSGQNEQIFLKTEPARAGVRVWQDGVYLGEIPADGGSFFVKPGRILLDARGLDAGISVKITYQRQRYTLEMTEEVRIFDIKGRGF